MTFNKKFTNEGLTKSLTGGIISTVKKINHTPKEGVKMKIKKAIKKAHLICCLVVYAWLRSRDKS